MHTAGVHIFTCMIASAGVYKYRVHATIIYPGLHIQSIRTLQQPRTRSIVKMRQSVVTACRGLLVFMVAAALANDKYWGTKEGECERLKE